MDLSENELQERRRKMILSAFVCTRKGRLSTEFQRNLNDADVRVNSLSSTALSVRVLESAMMYVVLQRLYEYTYFTFGNLNCNVAGRWPHVSQTRIKASIFVHVYSVSRRCVIMLWLRSDSLPGTYATGTLRMYRVQLYFRIASKGCQTIQ